MQGRCSASTRPFLEPYPGWCTLDWPSAGAGATCRALQFPATLTAPVQRYERGVADGIPRVAAQFRES